MSFARVRALAVVGALFVGAAIVVAAALLQDSQTSAHAGECPPGFVQADLRPRKEQDIKINVYNGTDRQGLAQQVAFNFENRSFTVVNMATIKQANDPLKKRVDGVATLRYGPNGVGSAWVLRAYFLNKADTEFDINRKDDVVDVVLGNQFQELGTITEVKKTLALLGNPVAPKGTCDAHAR